MIRIFRWLIWGDGHAHKWTIIHNTKIFAHEGDALPVGQVVLMQCHACGTLKKVRVQ